VGKDKARSIPDMQEGLYNFIKVFNFNETIVISPSV
jgi:hypothetical protein